MYISPVFQKYEGRTHTDNMVIPCPPFVHGYVLRHCVLYLHFNEVFQPKFLIICFSVQAQYSHIPQLLCYHYYFIIVITIIILVTVGADLRHYWTQCKNKFSPPLTRGPEFTI
jgi:hypothetical protein